MSYRHHFSVEDVTCEKCDERVANALLALPGTQHVELSHMPQNIAEVILITNDIISREQIENAITQQSVGTTHNYKVLWNM